jgi:DNA invertase Pin-like site-specific DNA recombinase
MKTVAYLRVSTEEQADSGLSLQHQARKTAAMADLHDWDLLDTLQDAGATAKHTNRPGLQEILSLVRARKVEAVVVYKLDRLTRSLRDLLDILEIFKRYRVRLVSVSENLDTESATGRMMVSLLGVIAEWERDIIGERTSAALSQLRTNGKQFSGIPPYGWRYEAGTMHEVPEEQDTLDTIQTLHEAGHSLRSIGAELDKAGREPRTGKRWHPKVLAGLTSPK